MSKGTEALAAGAAKETLLSGTSDCKRTPAGIVSMHYWDWTVLVIYFCGVLFLGAWFARRQNSTEDYFLGGKRMPFGLVGVSLAANQVSAISLVSAPAFVALQPDGGLRWLQYEFAVPLAMVGIIILLGPIYPRLSSASLYEFAERRFGRGVRLALSSVFLVSRGLATGVALYATALVLSVAMDFPLVHVYFVLGLFAVAYTTLGGIQADVYSDVIQFVVLWVGTLVAIGIAWNLLEDAPSLITQLDSSRLAAVDLSHHGLGDGKTFSFWPMLLGAFFLYMSYYGCDQSQAQRLMATGSLSGVRKSLLVNGTIRFPVVLTYCLFGLLLAALLRQEPSFAATLSGKRADYLVPAFLVTYLPAGFRGLFMAGIFAAAMSSIDSALNSLSAITVEDFLSRSSLGKFWSGKHGRLRLSRALTLLWGLFCLASGLLIARSSRTVIELVNMVGSAFYGPILAVFVCGLLSRRVQEAGMMCGLLGGVFLNFVLWRAAPQVSWLWWNPVGFLAAILLAKIVSLFEAGEPRTKHDGFRFSSDPRVLTHWNRVFRQGWSGSRNIVWILFVYFIIIIVLTVMGSRALTRLL